MTALQPASGTSAPSTAARRRVTRTPGVPRKRRNTAPAHPSRRRLRIGFSGALAGCLIALLGHAYVLGHGADVGLGGFVKALLSASSSKGTAVFVALGILIVAAWCFRRVWLERLASGPGRIEVPNFSTATKLSDDADPAHLTALFRQRLATLRLQSPAPVPGSEPPGDFLEVLGNGTVDAKNPLATALSVLRAAKPSHAWEVHGVLVERDFAPRYGVVVQVARAPDLGAPPDAIFDYTWERVIRRAADRATAHILPRTRACRSPWASWRGFVMPPELIEKYENAVDMENQRRYDQALDGYYEALRHDPLNLPLRLQLGQLQEKLGLYLDALSTYQGIVGVAQSDDGPDDEGRDVRAERWHVLLAANYRRIVLIGGPELAHQWYHVSEGTSNAERDRQRASLRERLTLQLRTPLEDCTGRLGTTPATALLLAPDVRPLAPRARRDRMELELRELLAEYALKELHGARDCWRKARALWRSEDELPVTATGLELTRVCIEERRRCLRVQLGDAPRRWTEADVERIKTAIEERPKCRWHEHYTAACAFALPLLDDEEECDDVRDRLAEEAVRQLKLASACADSGYIASRRDWLLAEDPDLSGLRPHAQFKAFEAVYLPSGQATPQRPRKVRRLEATRYTDELFVAAARRCSSLWCDRATAANGFARAADWWRIENRLWLRVAHAAGNYRHWRARLELLDAVDSLSLASKQQPLDVAFRRYDEPAPDGAPPNPEETAGQCVKRSKDRFAALAATLAPTEGADSHLASAIDRWIQALRSTTSGQAGPSPGTIAGACRRQAAIWDRLAEWVSAEDAEDVVRARERFGGELERTAAFLVAHSPD